MIKYKHLWLLTTMFVFLGCDLIDKAENEIERIKNRYEEYIGEKDDRGERPFTVTYQEDENAKTILISSQCTNNVATNYVYYGTVADANRQYLNDTQSLITYPGYGNLKPFWDMRYVNPVERYMNGGEYSHYPNHGEKTGLDTRNGIANIGIGTDVSKVDAGGVIAQSECINGSLAGGTTINLWDAPEQYINYGGPQSTFSYRLQSTVLTSPWNASGAGNLIIQGYFDKPIYNNYGGNTGGSASIGLFIKNKRTNKLLNYVIGIYASGSAWMKEKSGIKFDTSSNIVHIATVASENSWWSTISPKSKAIQEVFNTPNGIASNDEKWNDFYRVNISYQNLLAALQELSTNPPPSAEGQNFGLNPEDWEITSIMLQYELEEQGGKASFSGSFRGFEAYISNLPL